MLRGMLYPGMRMLSMAMGMESIANEITDGEGVHGSMSASFGSLTSNAAGTVTGRVGQLAKTLGALTVSATAVAEINGEANITLGALTSTAAGSVSVKGALAQTLGALTVSAAGSVSVKGELAKTLGALTASAAGTVATSSILVSELTTGQNNADGTTFTPASIAPGSNKLVLAWVFSAQNSGTVAPTMTGNGLTWVQVNTVTNGARRCTLFRAMGASPTSEAPTISFSTTQILCTWSIVECSNVDTGGTNGSGAIVQNAVANGATSITSSLAAFASSSNFNLSGCGANTNAVPGLDADFTGIGSSNTTVNGNSGIRSMYAQNQTGCTATTGAGVMCMVSVEVKKA